MLRLFGKLIGKISFLAGLVLLTYVVSISIASSGKNSGANGYLAGIIDKHRLLDSTPSPRIIFVGGSNLALGLDSEMVQERLGMPVVNMGVNAGFGLAFMLSEIRPSLRKGDVVVLIPEYEQFYGHLYGGTTLIEALTIFPQGLEYLHSPKQWALLLPQFPTFVQGSLGGYFASLSKGDSFSINRRSYDRFGDITAHLDQPSPVDIAGIPLFGPDEKHFDDESISFLNEFVGYARGQGALVYLIFPPLPEIQFRDNQDQIHFAFDQLKHRSEAVVLGSPEECIYPVSFFFDTPYHLNRNGRTIRTERVIDDLVAAPLN